MWIGDPTDPRQAPQRPRPDRLQARLGGRPRQRLRHRPDHHRRNRARHQQRLHRGRDHPVRSHEHPRHRPVRAALRHLPSRPARSTAALGLSSFSAWLLFAQSAQACGANLTRTACTDTHPRRPAGPVPALGAAEPVDPERSERVLRRHEGDQPRASPSSTGRPTRRVSTTATRPTSSPSPSPTGRPPSSADVGKSLSLLTG